MADVKDIAVKVFGDAILMVGPSTYIPLPVYPAAGRLCIYAQLNGGGTRQIQGRGYILGISEN